VFGKVLSESVSLADSITKLLNGLRTLYQTKYTSRGSSHSAKYTTRGTTYTDKYTH
jgi:hypothetical protein